MSQATPSELIRKMAGLARDSQSALITLLLEIYKVPIPDAGTAHAVILAHHKLGDVSDDFFIRYIGRMKSYLLGRENYGPVLSDETAAWLMASLESAGSPILLSEADLILGLLDEIQLKSDTLAQWLARQLSRRMIEQGYATREDTTRLVRTLKHYRAPIVSRQEARLLLSVNDAIASSENDVSWSVVFSRGIANFLVSLSHPEPLETDPLNRTRWLTADRRNIHLLNDVSFNAGQSGWFDRIAASADHAELARQVLSPETPRLNFSARMLGKRSRDTGPSPVPEAKWIVKRLGWKVSASPAERALTQLLEVQAPRFLRALPIAVPA